MAIESRIMEHVRSVLEKFDNKYIENGILKKAKVIEDLDNYDRELMAAPCRPHGHERAQLSGYPPELLGGPVRFHRLLLQAPQGHPCAGSLRFHGRVRGQPRRPLNFT